jgi:hypothetical protein
MFTRIGCTTNLWQLKVDNNYQIEGTLPVLLLENAYRLEAGPEAIDPPDR